MSRGFQGAMLKALGANEHTITVTDAADVVDGLRRVYFTSTTVFEDFRPGPTDFLRLWVPDPDNPTRELQRGYTVLDADPSSGSFAIDFVLHEPHGPASSWAAGAQPGDTLPATVYGTAAFALPSPEPAGCLLVGDAASTPAINSVLEMLPAHLPVEVILEWGDARELNMPLVEHPAATVRRVRRDGNGEGVTELLAGRDWSDWYAWIGSERAAVKAVKTALRETHGFPKNSIKAQAYWIHGKSLGASRGGAHSAATAPPAGAVPVGTTDEPDRRDEPSGSAAAGSAHTLNEGRNAGGSGALTAAPSPATTTNIPAVEAPVPSSVVDREAEVLAPAARSAHQAAGSTTTRGRSAVAGGRWRSAAGAELLAPLRPTLRLAALAQVLLTLAELVPFVLLAEVGRRLLGGAAVEDQWPLARLALIILGSATALAALLMWRLHVLDARFALALRGRLLAKLARLPLGWFTERNSGVVKQAVTGDTASLHYYVTHAAVDVAGAITAPLAVLVYLFVVDGRLAAVLLLPIIAYLFVFAGMMQASRGKLGDVAIWTQRMSGEAVAYLDGLPVVRVFGGAATSRFRRTVDGCLEFLAEWQRPLVARKAIAALLTDAVTLLAVIVVAGAALVSLGTLSPGDLLPFLLLGTTFGTRLLALAYNAAGLREARMAAQRIGITLTEPELDVLSGAGAGVPSPSVARGVQDSRDPGATDVVDGATVELRGVTFGYRPGQPVVHDIDLMLRPGTVTALVGASGSGKSTIAALVARFHDPDAGSITIDGVDIRALAADELYRQVGFVLQDVHVLRASLFDNIALARPDADRAAVAAAARAAQLDELIARLPHGDDTLIGDTVQLSGGEAQRVAIARAILADTPVVVLDEATAFADPESERQVQLALSRLLAGRTVLVVAHRLHTVADADAIVVLDDGRIVERGSHTELLAADGRYRGLWDTATAGVSR